MIAQRVEGSPTSNIPDAILEEYWEFRDVYSGEKVNILAPHWPYNLQIKLEEGSKPAHRPIYSLSPPKLVAL